MQGYLDTHSHLADIRWKESLPEVLERSKKAGVVGWLQGGVGPEDWDRQSQLATKFPGFLPVFGLHPWWVAEKTEEEIVEGLHHLRSKLSQAVALGEAGLDWMDRFKGSESRQLMAFEGQVELAKDTHLPLVLHVVRAHNESLALLKRLGGSYRGLVHSFSGGLKEAEAYIELGFLISFSGSITKKGFQGVKEAAAKIPLESLLVETDSPDQAPVFAGTALNEPANLIGIADCLAELRGMRGSEVLSLSTQNAERMLGKSVERAFRRE